MFKLFRSEKKPRPDESPDLPAPTLPRQPPERTFDLDCFGSTDIGCVRERNEDHFLVAQLRKSLSIEHTSLPRQIEKRIDGEVYAWLLMVADGMGGMGHGDAASQMVIETLMRYAIQVLDWLDLEDEIDADEIAADLAMGIGRCKERLDREAAVDGSMLNMGSTLTLAYVIESALIVLHLGDSRCYLLRDGTLELVTGDHTMARRMVEEGILRPEEMEGHRWNHILWKAIGATEKLDIRPDVIRRDLKDGDHLLLCSDGLTKHLGDREIETILKGQKTAEAACLALVEAAKGRGGSDNITVLVARCLPRGPGEQGLT